MFGFGAFAQHSYSGILVDFRGASPGRKNYFAPGKLVVGGF